MKLNRAERRKAARMKLSKCPKCGNFKVGAGDNFEIPGSDGVLCFDCGVEVAGTLIKETDKDLAVLTVVNDVKKLHLVDNVFEVASFVGADKTWTPEINFEYGNPVLWFVRGASKTPERRVVRCGAILKGLDKCSEFIRHVPIENLVPDETGNLESEHFILTPMLDAMKYQVCWRVTIKESGKTIFMPLDGFRGGSENARKTTR